MLTPDKLARINELAHKSKTTGLSKEEAAEQTTLRKEYLVSFRKSMRATIENVTIMDEEGNDVTPEKVRAAKERNKNKEQ